MSRLSAHATFTVQLNVVYLLPIVHVGVYGKYTRSVYRILSVYVLVFVVHMNAVCTVVDATYHNSTTAV